MSTPYDVLGVPASADARQIKSAYRGLAKRLHPDAGGDIEHFRRVSAAYTALTTVPQAKPPGPWREPFRRILWLPVMVSLLWFATAAFAFVIGDRPQGYNGWLVGLGWVAVVLGWRAFADRRTGLRNPVSSLVQGGGIIAASAVLLVLRLGLVLLAILGIAWVLAGAEWIVAHLT